MTKAENRAAAKAYQEEKQRRWREEAHAAAVAADLEQLAALRKYLLFDREARQVRHKTSVNLSHRRRLSGLIWMAAQQQEGTVAPARA
jgi:hypothetical protein